MCTMFCILSFKTCTGIILEQIGHQRRFVLQSLISESVSEVRDTPVEVDSKNPGRLVTLRDHSYIYD